MVSYSQNNLILPACWAEFPGISHGLTHIIMWKPYEVELYQDKKIPRKQRNDIKDV